MLKLFLCSKRGLACQIITTVLVAWSRRVVYEVTILDAAKTPALIFIRNNDSNSSRWPLPDVGASIKGHLFLDICNVHQLETVVAASMRCFSFNASTLYAFCVRCIFN